MNDNLAILANKSLLDAGLITQEEYEKKVSVILNPDVKTEDAKNEIDRFFAKLMLNALYGKFGQFGKQYNQFTYEVNNEYREEVLRLKDELNSMTASSKLSTNFRLTLGPIP